MPSLPPPLRSGDPINTLVPWAARVIDYLRAITPRPSATVRIQTQANGTIFHAAAAASAGRSGSGPTPRFGFLVSIDGEGHVKVETGTAQAWGGAVKVYPADDLGEVAEGYVYARLDLETTPPSWDDDLIFDSMTGQDADTEVWVPIAHIRNAAKAPEEAAEGEEEPAGGEEEPAEPDPVWIVTQLHWGNIVIPATTNAVDVQEHAQQQQSE